MSDTRSFAERLFDAGFLHLIPVVPPGAPLTPLSKLSPGQLGKSPGECTANGLWRGMAWRQVVATAEDVKRWASWGANIGLKSDYFPAVDIDCADEALAKIVEDATLAFLGPAPVRIGNPPKRLLPYRTTEPFSRMRLLLKREDKQYLVEILGQGQQYLVAGTHPTGRAYTWNEDLCICGSEALTPITRGEALAFLDNLAGMLTDLGYECTRMGDGMPQSERSTEQRNLEAPSIDDLRAAVAMIPNPDTNRWEEFIRMLYAVKAAAGEQDEDGFEIFAEWANRWGDTAVGEDPRSLWRRTRGPYVLGWSWIAEMARPHGFNDAPFGTEGEAPSEPTPAEQSLTAPYLSDQWLALRVVEAAHSVLRYVPAQGRWLVWNRGKWQPDAEMLAEDIIKGQLRLLASGLDGHGASDKERKKNDDEARNICSGAKAAAVRLLAQSDRDIAVNPDALDFDPWMLNTPAGIIDLKTGVLRPADPDQLCTKSTTVVPNAAMKTPEWDRFLEEATGGDKGLQGYMRRLGGYTLTGATYEQQFTFIYGTGGNGKGEFLKVLNGVLGDYATTAPMDTFIESHNDRHATELAGLIGARLVSASETGAGRRWNEGRLKAMTGGDLISARFMRQDFFRYQPQFKLVFIGNHKPEIRDLDEAMRRRTHLVPFVVTPKVRDNHLGEKLKVEWPGILAWFLAGCLEWQQIGLAPPTAVLEATAEYLSESDPVSRWIDECCERAPGTWVELTTLFGSWQEWGNQNKEYVGKVQRLGQILATKKFEKRKHHTSRRAEIGGLKLANRQAPIEEMTK